MNKTALLFAGQGAQVVGMGKDLAAGFPLARGWFERANETLGYDLTRICFGGPEAELTKTENAQPGIFLVGWVAWRLLAERVPELRVEATAGLSLGEFTALAAANTFDFEDAISLVCQRGRFMQEACEATRGGMVAVVGLDEPKTREVCQETGVEIANLNCPGQIVISGPVDALGRACELVLARGAKRALPLAVAGAYHSRLMAGARSKLEAALSQTRLRAPSTLVLSNVTGMPHGGPEEIRRRLAEQVTGSVRWEDSIRHLVGLGFRRFIELGPGTALSGFMKRIERGAQALHVGDVASLEQTVEAIRGT